MIAKILINTSVNKLNKVYDYTIPEELKASVEVGKRVLIGFGKGNRNEEGIVVKIEAENKADLDSKHRKYVLKSIIQVLDEVSYITEDRLKLAKWMSYVYFCNVYDAIKLMLPPGTTSKNSSKSVNSKYQTVISLNRSSDDILFDIDNDVIKSPKHIRLLKFIIENEVVLLDDVVSGLGISKAIVNTVVKNDYIKLENIEIEADFINEFNIERTFPIKPTIEQEKTIENISKYIDEEVYKKCLVFGVTGSGKTEVYLQVIEKVLKKGKKVIVLVPEISLTHQAVTRFVARFGNDIAILHSKMTISRRKEEYRRIKLGKANIIIGARSAIFAPVDNLGLVIIDEEHDLSYYSQTKPKYSTKEVAEYLCRLNEAVLVLGSATPEITSYYEALNGSSDLSVMENRPKTAKLPDVELVDMKLDKLSYNKSILSNRLKAEIIKNIEKKEQTMIFLNRRGYSSYLKCNECGYLFKCKNCDVGMTYHKNNNLLICHYCSFVSKNIKECPICKSQNIIQSGIGTEKIEEELNSIYPGITMLRMDADTTTARGSHQKILDEFKSKNVNVLIGTQMISKGHDIENVTLVGVLGTDSLLAMNDYLAGERAFDNLLQVAGRAGRGSKAGRVLIQSYEADNYILDAVKNHSYIDFYNSEIEFRKNVRISSFYGYSFN